MKGISIWNYRMLYEGLPKGDCMMNTCGHLSKNIRNYKNKIERISNRTMN